MNLFISDSDISQTIRQQKNNNYCSRVFLEFRLTYKKNRIVINLNHVEFSLFNKQNNNEMYELSIKIFVINC